MTGSSVSGQRGTWMLARSGQRPLPVLSRLGDSKGAGDER